LLLKYLLEFVFRYDGSQVFPEGKRYGFFPGVSAGWRLSEEEFLANLPFISELKLRGPVATQPFGKPCFWFPRIAR